MSQLGVFGEDRLVQHCEDQLFINYRVPSRDPSVWRSFVGFILSVRPAVYLFIMKHTQLYSLLLIIVFIFAQYIFVATP